MSDTTPDDVRIHGFVHELPSITSKDMIVEPGPPNWRPINVHELLLPSAQTVPADDTSPGAST